MILNENSIVTIMLSGAAGMFAGVVGFVRSDSKVKELERREQESLKRLNKVDEDMSGMREDIGYIKGSIDAALKRPPHPPRADG